MTLLSVFTVSDLYQCAISPSVRFGEITAVFTLMIRGCFIGIPTEAYGQIIRDTDSKTRGAPTIKCLFRPLVM